MSKEKNTPEIVRDDRPLEVNTIGELTSISNLMFQSGLFKDVTSLSQAAVKIMAGREIGIAPFRAMSGLHIVEGSVMDSGNLISETLKSSAKYDYRVVELTNGSCTIDFYLKKPDGSLGEKLGDYTFTIEDAKTAGARFKSKNGALLPWSKFPRAMLFNRCISAGYKVHCPDIFKAAVYVEGEIVPEETHVEAVARIDEETRESVRTSTMAVLDIDGDDDDVIAASVKETEKVPEPKEPEPVKTEAPKEAAPVDMFPEAPPF